MTAGGLLIAEKVRLLTSKDENDITLTADIIQVGYIDAGVYAETQAEADALHLGYFNAALRAIGVIVPDDGDPDTHNDEDWTLEQAQIIGQRADYSQIRDDLIGRLESNGASNAEAAAEADAILSLETQLTSLGDVSLTGYGAILEMTPEDNDVDLIADEVTLIAGGDSTGLEIAVNTIVEVGSDTGSIGLSDFDGVDEKRPGLVVMSATSLSANTVSVAISAEDDLNVGRLNSDDTIDTGSVSVGGAHSTNELGAR